MPGHKTKIFLSPPHMGGAELAYIGEAFASNYIAPHGPMLDRFEQAFARYSGISHCLAVSSGTAAMHLALRCLGIGRGDVVAVSTLTFIGGVSPVCYQGAQPLFIDSDTASWNMAPELLAAALEADNAESGRIKAVVPTDIYGQCADYDRIQKISDRYNVPLIVDSAEAVGAVYKGRHAGKGPKAAVFSFNGNKILTASGGGMLASDDGDFIEYARYLAQQAKEPLPHYEHKELGYNYRMSNIMAAIGLGQMEVIQERIAQKREIFQTYYDGLGDLPGLTFMPEAQYGIGTRWLTVVCIDPGYFGTDREAVRRALQEEGVESRPVWKPLHRQPVFRQAMAIGGEVAESLYRTGLCLPSGTAMTSLQLDHIISTIRTLHNRERGRVAI